MSSANVNTTPSRNLPGFFKQLRIILWKNNLLLCQNKASLISEITFSLTFALILMLMVYLNDPKKTAPRQFNQAMNVLGNLNLRTDKKMYYYPNNQFVRGLIVNALKLIEPDSIKLDKYLSKNLIGTNSSDAKRLSDTVKEYMFAQVSFPSNFMSYKNLFNKNIYYSIYTTE